MGIVRGKLSEEQIRARLHDAIRLPRMVESGLELDGRVLEVARR